LNPDFAAPVQQRQAHPVSVCVALIQRCVNDRERRLVGEGLLGHERLCLAGCSACEDRQDDERSVSIDAKTGKSRSCHG
jgi:hypothetical protein